MTQPVIPHEPIVLHFIPFALELQIHPESWQKKQNGLIKEHHGNISWGHQHNMGKQASDHGVGEITNLPHRSTAKALGPSRLAEEVKNMLSFSEMIQEIHSTNQR